MRVYHSNKEVFLYLKHKFVLSLFFLSSLKQKTLIIRMEVNYFKITANYYLSK
jgi:hypothetical protein